MVSGKHVCSDSCGTAVSAQQQANSELLLKNRFGYKLLPPLLIAMGVMFLILAISSVIVGRFGRVDLMVSIIGLLFCYFGVSIHRSLKSVA